MKEKLPIEYERGFTKFLNCRIDLSKKVFIPRIETEFWVKKAIKEIQYALTRRSSNYRVFILDMFAGSGCIGIAASKSIKNSRVDFVDNDKKAIEQIKINLRLNHVPQNRYKIYKSNLFEKLKRKYDYIFANPPYVAKERIAEVEPSVLKYEPKRAILAGKKGLFYIRKFLKEAKKFLKPESIIYLELDPLQKREIENILKKEKYKNFKFFKDQFKKYRWVRIISF
jgi:release factor glutamine methyltransferase